jgi:dipeptidyl aminopeptidase/acylaminoacyl peptidase
MLPDGKTLLFSLWNDTGWEPARIAAQRVGEESRTVVVPAGGGYPRYIADGKSGSGYLVYSRAEGLLAARFDGARLALTSQPIPVVDGVMTNLSGGSHFDLSRSGTLAYVPGTTGEDEREMVWVSRDGKSTPARRIRNMGRFWSLAPDGARVVRNNTSGPNREVWVEDLARGTSTRLTISNDTYNPIWSHDGQWIAYARGLPNSAVFRQPATGGAEEQLTGNDINRSPGDFSPDGKTLAYVEFDPVTSSDIWVLSLGDTGERAARVFVKTNFSEGTPVFSPDGRWIAYASNATGRFEIYVRSFPDGERSQPVSSDGGIEPIWKGNELFYRGLNGQMMSVSLATGTDVRSSAPRALFDVTAFENVFAVDPTGERFLMMPLVDTEQAATHVRLVFNFLAELRQRVR